MPTASVIGLEAPQLQQAAGNAYWRAALAARSYVVSALRGRLPVEQVGLAVNSVGGRSQDQLHIHLDCIQPTVRAALKRHSHRLRETWSALPVPLVGHFLVRRINAAEVDSFNPFAALMHLPGQVPDLRAMSFAVIAREQNDPDKGFYMLAYRSRKAHAEKLLDHGCSAVSETASQ
jgi:CDP-diacylglycerol pyrophosphatase